MNILHKGWKANLHIPFWSRGPLKMGTMTLCQGHETPLMLC